MTQRNKGPLSHIILDEIALEGLEGVTIESLWVLVSIALDYPLPLEKNLQAQIWSFILNSDRYLLFYELPFERPIVKMCNRFEQKHIDPSIEIPTSPDPSLYTRYKFAPIQDGEIIGSCENYKDRLPIKFENIRGLSLEQVMQKWGNKLVIVGSQDLRYNALTPSNVAVPKDLTPIQYCMWEAIGRSRHNGETTAGPWSLQQYCRDSSVVFYIKNKLIRLGLIAQQNFTEVREERFFPSTLLTLTRFFALHKNVFRSVIEILVQVLKETPKCRIAYAKVHELFPKMYKNKTFKRIAMTHFFRSIFEVASIPALGAEDVIDQKGKMKKDRMVLVLQLKNPQISLDGDIFAENELENKDDTDEFFNEKHAFLDMPVMEQFYRCIERHGSRGCSQSDVCSYLAIHQLTVRQFVKRALDAGLITSYFTDIGRQRTIMYVAVTHSKTANKRDVSIAGLKSLKCAEEPNILVNSEDISLKDIPSINARIKNYEYEAVNTPRESTLRQFERKALVIKAIDAQGIVSVLELRRMIQSTEKENGYKDEVCQKSVRRLLAQMRKHDLIKAYEIILEFEENTRLFRYVSHPKITPDHCVMQREIIRLKNRFDLVLKERSLHLHKQTNVAEAEERNFMIPLGSYKSPKFLTARYLHELLFYMRYIIDDEHESIPVTKELIKRWQNTEPNLIITDYLQTLSLDYGNVRILPFREELTWRTFIPPLPKYEKKASGWMYLMDAVIDRMPLSIFNKIFRLNKDADSRLSDYLDHPIRQHYLIMQLPEDLHSQINRLRMQKILLNIIELLNNMGLIQVGIRQDKNPLRLWLYINRHAQILDTTSSGPGYSKISPDRTYPTINYVFNKADDVCNYWNTLHRICVHTKLGFLKNRLQRKTTRNRRICLSKPVQFDEAPQIDVKPCVPGDRMGAGGLSSNLFAHIFRSWSWVVHTAVESKKLQRERLTRSKIPKILIQNRTPTMKSSNRGKLHVIPLERLQMKTGRSNFKRTTSTSNQSKRSIAIRDAVDRDALKNMRTLRVKWCKDEDRILKMARAVFLYLSVPVVIFNLVAVGKICRDVIRQHLGICNKTSLACHRRGHFIVKMNRHLPEVPSWLHLLRTNAEIQALYGENFIKNLKEAYPNKTDLINAISIHFVFLMNYLNKMIDSSISVERPRFLIPDTVEEFHRNYKECEPVIEDRAIQHWNPKTETDLQMFTIINVLHSSLCCTRDKTLYNLQAFEIYKHYTEEILHEAFQKARSDGLVVAIKRKNMHSAPSQLTGPAYIFSQKYRMRLMYLRIPYAIYDAFFEFFCGALKSIYGPKTSKSSTKEYLELRSPNASQLFFIAEGLVNKRWQIDIKLPSSVLTVDAEKQESVSSMDRILDHYHCIFDNAPETEYLKQLETETGGERQARIRFHQANLSYKVYYNPFDLISKLPSRYLHFFCGLDHLEQDVNINFNKLQCSDDENNGCIVECPFNCIMKQGNYINAIERIVQEKKLILHQLQEAPSQELLDIATGDDTKVIVQPNNLLTLVRMLESFWYEKELQLERKDLGKISATLKSNKIIDWYQICTDIIEFNSAEDEQDDEDEYEPTLNKEERIARAQDVFAVNLPHLQLDADPELQSCTDNVMHEGVEVPKILVESALQRDEILRKIINESFWKYSEQTFESVLPSIREDKFTGDEIQHLQDIHDFIQRHKLGVSFSDLRSEFPFENFLIRALHTLSEHFLIKRVGVATFMYVHKDNIRFWVVHTFHVKRLEREVLGSTVSTLKRKRTSDYNKEDDGDVDVSNSKKCKLIDRSESSAEIKKRTPKATKRYSSENITHAETADITKEVIVMKPQPWMRLNGSLNRRVLDKWLGSILTECISRTGCLVEEIFSRFPHMFSVDIMFLLEVLGHLKCVRLREIQPTEVNLFSEYEIIREKDVNEIYIPKDTYVLAYPDALTKLSIFIGNKKYKTEFI